MQTHDTRVHTVLHPWTTAGQCWDLTHQKAHPTEVSSVSVSSWGVRGVGGHHPFSFYSSLTL